MLKVGITGGIASGKTTVAEMFRARGCRVLDADRIAHEMIHPGQPAYEEIIQAFGPDVVAADDSIDRERLGGIVFTDPARREQLNRIVHPRVIAAIEEEFRCLEREQPRAIAMVDAALLVEAGYHRKLDKLVVAWCRPEQQRERLLRKGLSSQQVEQRLAAQLPPEEKRNQADYEIDCSGPLAATEKQVEKVFQELQQLLPTTGG
jgi:dephospho-CoA kinase